MFAPRGTQEGRRSLTSVDERTTPEASSGRSDDADSPRLATIRIEAPRTAWASLKLRELWEYRELLYFFVWRDVKVRYKQTIFGGLWAVIRPLFTMVVFSIFFGRLAGVPSDGLPYPIFSFAALVPWQFFEQGVLQSSESLVGNARLVTRVYFPRLTIPIAAVLSGLVDFGVAFVILLILMAFYGIAPPIQALTLPLFLLLACITAIGVGLLLAGLNAKFRDVRYTVTFLTQAWLFLTPVAYPSSLLDEPWRTIYALNPMVGVVEGFRWGLLGSGDAPSQLVLVSSIVAIALLVGGAFYFRRLERTFADIV
jgi:lipopolysaccharide transport system permease protein